MARSVNSRTDSHFRSSCTAGGRRGSGMVSDGTCHSASPGTRSGSRLVASTTTPWLAASSAATARAALSIRYSQLSMTSRDRLPAMATATAASGDWPDCSPTARSLASARPTASSPVPDVTASSVSHTPSGNRPTARWATSTASRDLPQPPGPSRVISRRWPSMALSSASACSRPTNVLSRIGRLWPARRPGRARWRPCVVARCRGTSGVSRGRAGLAQPPGQHVAVQLLGPPVGRHGQAVPQGVGQRLVLAQRRAAVPGQRIAADQRPLCHLVGGVVGGQRGEQVHGRPRVAGRLAQRRQLGHQPTVPGAELVPASRGPVLIPVLGQQLPRVKAERCLHAGWISGSLGGGRRGLERLDVDPHRLVGAQCHPLVPHPQAGAARAPGTRAAGARAGGGVPGQPAPGDMQRLVQIVQAGVSVPLGPQRLDDLVPVPPVAGGQGEDLDHVPGLAQPPGAGRHRLAVNDQAEPAQQADFDRGHHPGGPPRTPIPHPRHGSQRWSQRGNAGAGIVTTCA